MLLYDKTNDQSGVGVEGRANGRTRRERTVKDDVRDRRIATKESENSEIPRPRNGMLSCL